MECIVLACSFMPLARRWVLAVGVLAGMLAVAPPAYALPQFARKYHMPCTGCHDALAFPRLNDVGYKFRRAGFRMPENIGKDELQDYTVDNYLSARVIADNTTTVVHQSGSTDTQNTWTGEFHLYALCGSFQKYFATETEVTVSPDAGAEVENAYVRFVYGDQHLWFEARAGIFHAFEGLGASDRSLGPSLPLIFDLTPNENQDTLMRMAELNRIGAEVGLQWEETSLSLEVVNRAHPVVDNGELAPEATTADSGGGKDLIVVANQILGTRSGLSAYWAHGRVALPIDEPGFIAGTSTATWNDQYDKLAAFASGGWSKLLFLGGAQLGFDHALAMGGGNTSRFTSIGAYAEANFGLAPWAYAWLRADYFDPSTSASDNEVFAGTAGLLFWQTWVSIAPELQVRHITNGETDGSLVVEINAIY